MLTFKNISILLFVLVIPLDLIYGYLRIMKDVDIPIGIIYRGIIGVVLLNQAISLKLNLFKLIFLFSLLLLIIFFPVWLFDDITGIKNNFIYLVKHVFFFSCFFYFYKLLTSGEVYWLIKLIVLSAFIISGLNILCFATGIGIHAYESYNFGCRIFYVDGNGLGLYLILSLAIAIWSALFFRKQYLWFEALVISVGTLLVASRTAIGGVFIIWGAILFYLLCCKDFSIKLSRSQKFVIFVLICGFLFFAIKNVITYIENSGDINIIRRFSLESASSPRKVLLYGWEQVWREYNTFEKLFGKGVYLARQNLGEVLLMSKARALEADFHELILFFGCVIGGLLICCYIYPCYVFLNRFLHKRNMINFLFFFVYVLWLGHAYMAGHAFANVMHAPLLAAFYALSHRLNMVNDKR